MEIGRKKTETSVSLIQKLEDDVWDTIKGSSTYNANLHAMKERLAKIREKAQSELDTLEAVKTNLTNMIGILDMDFIHANTMIKIEYAKELIVILGGH